MYLKYSLLTGECLRRLCHRDRDVADLDAADTADEARDVGQSSPGQPSDKHREPGVSSAPQSPRDDALYSNKLHSFYMKSILWRLRLFFHKWHELGRTSSDLFPT